MLICPYCQSPNPPGHNFCQSCGKPLTGVDSAEGEQAEDTVNQTDASLPLQATLLPDVSDSAASDRERASDNKQTDNEQTDNEQTDNEQTERAITLVSEAFLDPEKRYQVMTVLSQKTALVRDTKPQKRSPLQNHIAPLSQPSFQPFAQPSAPLSLDQLQAIPTLPRSLYPYYLLAGSAPAIYDGWRQAETTVVITQTESPPLSSILESFATAADALRHVYWLYSITELWVALEPLPEWRTSLLLADHLGIDSEHSVRVRDFAEPSEQPPDFSHLKAFLRSLLAQPNRVTVPPHPQIREIILTLSSATDLQQLRNKLSSIGEALLATAEAITPAHLPTATSTPQQTPIMAKNTSPTDHLATDPAESAAGASETDAEATLDPEEIELLGDPSDSGESTMVLPMQLVDIEEAGRTDVGRQRDHNEDRFFIRSSTQKHADNSGQITQAHSLYVLCDGMGGHAGGEVASRLAAETLSNYFTQHWPHPLPGEPLSPLPAEESITEAIRLANQAIFDVNEKEGRAGHERMGTTLVMVLLQGAEAVVAHVGDSRLYKYARRAGLQQMTIDHEVGQREIQRGIPQDLAYARPDAYQLTQALGPRGNDELTPSVSYLTFSEDTLLLLCSDGLSDNNLVEDHLESHIAPMLRGGKDMDTGVDELMKLANEVNGHDNISAIAIRAKVSPDLSGLSNTPRKDRGLTVIQ